MIRVVAGDRPARGHQARSRSCPVECAVSRAVETRVCGWPHIGQAGARRAQEGRKRRRRESGTGAAPRPGSARRRRAPRRCRATGATTLASRRAAVLPDADAEGLAGEGHPGETCAVGRHRAGVAVQQRVDDRLAGHAVRAQAVQDGPAESPRPRRIPGPSAAGCGRRRAGTATPAAAGSGTSTSRFGRPVRRAVRGGRAAFTTEAAFAAGEDRPSLRPQQRAVRRGDRRLAPGIHRGLALVPDVGEPGDGLARCPKAAAVRALPRARRRAAPCPARCRCRGTATVGGLVMWKGGRDVAECRQHLRGVVDEVAQLARVHRIRSGAQRQGGRAGHRCCPRRIRWDPARRPARRRASMGTVPAPPAMSQCRQVAERHGRTDGAARTGIGVAHHRGADIADGVKAFDDTAVVAERAAADSVRTATLGAQVAGHHLGRVERRV